MKNVKVNAANKTFLTVLNKTGNERLTRLMTAWNAMPETKVALNVKTVKIKAVKDLMKFDITEFTVKPGQSVEIIFENPDAMQHNIVIVKPGTNEKVGKAADKMLDDEKGVEKNYVPPLPEVLFATPLINASQSFTLKFKAPTTPGDYPFICTFPGHWQLMSGVMRVR